MTGPGPWHRPPVRARAGAAPRASALALATALGGLLASAWVLLPAAPAVAYPSANVVVTGHGYGHGHGMGQWGALGYALDGWSHQQIIGHYYGQTAGGATTLGPLTTGQEGSSLSGGVPYVRVDLTENDGDYTTVYSGASGGFDVGGVAVPPDHAALIAPVITSTSVPPDQWTIAVGPSCSGPWGTAVATPPGTGPVLAAVPDHDPALGAAGASAEALQACFPADGSSVAVRGDLWATVNSNDALRTVNVLPLEQYVAGVVPNESPAYWGTLGSTGAQGQPEGFQELEAQAIAARSYVMSDLGGYGGYADICDSTACQDYAGLTNETALSDLAVTDTAGLVVSMPGGAVATTQYSASTGGYTAGGTFSPVVDAGDAVCDPQACNPDHTWTVTIPVSAVEAAYPQIGTLESVDVTQRNGLGDLGGRVESMVIVGSAGSVTTTGDGFAAAFAGYGMLSDWFAVSSQPSGGVGGYWLAAADGGVFSFGDAKFHGSEGGVHLNAPVVAMGSTHDHGGYWLAAADGGVFSFGDAHFWGSEGGVRLNAPIVGMASVPGGGGYWLVAADGGVFSFGSAGYHGSEGGVHLDAPIVGMAATPDGGGYWLVAADGGVFSFGDARYWGSEGGKPLNAPIVGMAAVPGGAGYWLVASDGGVFSFGSARYQGSLPGIGVPGPAAAMVPTATGSGYLIVTTDGRVLSLGDAPAMGDVRSVVDGYSGHVVGAAATP